MRVISEFQLPRLLNYDFCDDYYFLSAHYHITTLPNKHSPNHKYISSSSEHFRGFPDPDDEDTADMFHSVDVNGGESDSSRVSKGDDEDDGGF